MPEDNASAKSSYRNQRPYEKFPHLRNTMRGIDGRRGNTQTKIHGVTQADPPSCEVPPGQTITLEEWKRQNADWFHEGEENA